MSQVIEREIMPGEIIRPGDLLCSYVDDKTGRFMVTKVDKKHPANAQVIERACKPGVAVIDIDGRAYYTRK